MIVIREAYPLDHWVLVKLPAFSANEHLTWFRSAETRLRLKNIIRTNTKADYVLEALPESVFRRISARLDDEPAR